MGNAAIYYYPDPSGTLETIDLGEPLTDLSEIPLREIGQGVSLMGYPSTHVYRGSMRVRVQLRDVATTSSAGQALQRHLMSLSAHLERGGIIGVAADSAKTWGSALYSGTINRGDSNLYHRGDLWYASGSLTAGDELVIESANPEMLREMTTVSSTTGRILTITPTARYSYSGKPWVRHRNFYPALYWPEDERGTPIITDERRVRFSLDLTLEVAWSVLTSVAEGAATFASGTVAVGTTLDKVHAAGRLASSTGKPPRVAISNVMRKA